MVSPEVSAERRITFRILAPKAEAVRLSAGDIPGNGQGAPLAKGTNNVWEVTIGPIDAGAYRYNFNVDGVAVIDRGTLPSANPTTTSGAWSMFPVPASRTPWMFRTGRSRRSPIIQNHWASSAGMHVYTPPGYELGKGKYPVFYLLHGAGDCDEAWTSVGRAGFILDNLIAAGKAKPMVVAMPAGHTRAFGFGPRSGASTNGPSGRTRPTSSSRISWVTSCPAWRAATASTPTGSIAPLPACPWAAARRSISPSLTWRSLRIWGSSAPG